MNKNDLHLENITMEEPEKRKQTNKHTKTSELSLRGLLCLKAYIKQFIKQASDSFY